MASGREMAGVALTSVVLFLAMPTAASAGNRLVNPDAEAGLAGWQGAGFGVTANDGTIKSYPAARGAELGAQVFIEDGSPGISVISQTVDLSDVAAVIDTGYQDVAFGGLFGGRAGGFVSTSYLTVQPLSATSVALGHGGLAGRPGEADREFNRGVVSCQTRMVVPIGTRTMLVQLHALGFGVLADQLNVSTDPLAVPLAFDPTIYRPTGGSGCFSGIPAALPPAPPLPPPAPTPTLRPAPSLKSLVTIPTSNRCGRPRMLRFGIQKRWRSKVKSLDVMARGLKIIAPAGKTIKVIGPRRRLTVKISVHMKDGASRSGTRRFWSCGRASH